MQIEPPLLITGCPRSGTSLTAHAFRACGMWTGGTTTQCENSRIRQEVLKPMLHDGGMDRLALRTFADVEGDPDQLRQDVEAILNRQAYTGGPWLYKDAKLVFCWRTWAEAFPDATWVTVWRPPQQILESFGRWGMGDKIRFDGEEVIQEHHDRARAITDALPVFPDHLLEGDASSYQAAARAHGIEWSRYQVSRVVDPDRYHLSPS